MKCSNQNTIVAVGCLLALAGACTSEPGTTPSNNAGSPGAGGTPATGTGSTAAPGTGGGTPTTGTGSTAAPGTGGTGTGGTNTGTGGVEPVKPTMCAAGNEPMGMCSMSASGVFAIKTVVDVWWKDEKNAQPLIDPGRGNIEIVLKAELGVCGDGKGEVGKAVIRACGNKVPYFKSDANCDAFQIVLPDELWDNPLIPSFTSTASFTGFDPGKILKLEVATGLIGIKLATPDAVWPTPAMTAQTMFPDDDGDKHPGVTIKMGRIGEEIPTLKCGGFQLPFIFRGAPLDALGALADNGLKAETLYIGLRTTLGGGGAIGADCKSGSGESEVKAIDSRVFDCVRTDKTPCDPMQAMFVDNSAPNYHILKKGEAPPADIKQPMYQCPGMVACGLDPTPSKGPISTLVRLGDLGMDVNCAAVRAAKFPAM